MWNVIQDYALIAYGISILIFGIACIIYMSKGE